MRNLAKKMSAGIRPSFSNTLLLTKVVPQTATTSMAPKCPYMAFIYSFSVDKLFCWRVNSTWLTGRCVCKLTSWWILSFWVAGHTTCQPANLKTRQLKQSTCEPANPPTDNGFYKQENLSVKSSFRPIGFIQFLVIRAGFKPATFWSVVRCSIQLS